MRHNNQPGLSGTQCWVGGVDRLLVVDNGVGLSVAPVRHQVGRRSTTVLLVSLEKKKSVGVDIVAIADSNRWLGTPLVALRLPPNSPLHVHLSSCPYVSLTTCVVSFFFTAPSGQQRPSPTHKIIHCLHMCRHTHAHVPHVHPVVDCTAPPPRLFHCISTCSLSPPPPLSSFLKGQGRSHQVENNNERRHRHGIIYISVFTCYDMFF